jgi:hypothetical protein
MIDYTQIRLECLRLVLEAGFKLSGGDKLDDNTVIAVAGKFADFVWNDVRPAIKATEG